MKTLYVGPQSGVSEMAMDPNDPNVLYAGIWQFRREPWTFHSGGPDDGLYKSVDGGKTWAKLTGHGLPSGTTGRIAVAVAPSDSKRVYAIIESQDGILWRSDDAGATWKMTSGDSLVDQRPFYFTHLNVDPKNADHVYAVSEMLAESKDGGKKFAEIAKDVHVDYHAMWIAPNDPDRMMVGEDGGYALTLDGGKHWSFSRNIPIGQVYHVGLSLHENPYWVCAPLQDNNGFCGPSNGKHGDGIHDEDWLRVIPGDGMWAVPDPSNPNVIVTDLQDGRVAQFDKKTRQNRFVMPYFDFSTNDFALYRRKYRFNWDSPISFAPWNPHVLWYGGNVVFQSTDEGLHWTPVSPDLTLNVKAHQQPAGGPLVHDVSGAEYSDTILDIEGSQARRNEIWVGTDDGVVQLTLDGGKHWKNVSPKGIPPYGRVEIVAPSALDPATAYVQVDRHRSGDYAPYAFVTHDYGARWTKIVNGLPADQYVRTVRPDSRTRGLLYAGTENGLWISYDDGAHWNDFKLNLPTVSVRDIRIQPEFNDIAIATHGRALWIMDDVRALQELPQAQRQGAMLFKPRPVYQYMTHSEDEGLYTRFAGQNPPSGAIIDYYMSAAQKTAPSIQILDASGRVIRTIEPVQPKKDEKNPEKAGPSNDPGLNRYVWDLRASGVPQWMGAAKEEYRGAKEGLAVLPGRYSVRMTINGRAFVQPLEVKADPQNPYTLAQMRQAHAFAQKYLNVDGQINVLLNHLDAQKKSLETARAAVSKGSASALSDKVDAAMKARDEIFALFTADYHNDEDSIQRPGALREDVPGGFFGAGAPPTQAQLEFAKRFDAAYARGLERYNAYVRDVLTPLSTALKAAGQPAIAQASPVK
jgi:photosystem II stability/assembly factor-like uncharacterized protein